MPIHAQHMIVPERRMTMLSKSDKIISSIRDMVAKQDKLYEELAFSMTIEDMVPAAFEHGSIQLKWITHNREIIGGELTDGNGIVWVLPNDAASRLGVTIEDLENMENDNAE